MIVTREQEEQLKQWLGRYKMKGILFRPDPNTPNIAAAFHSECDDRGSTLVIAQTKSGVIYGTVHKQTNNAPAIILLLPCLFP